MSDFKLMAAIAVVAAILGGLMGIAAYEVSWNGGGTTIACITKGANLLQKSTKDGKYLSFWCVKNGKVVP